MKSHKITCLAIKWSVGVAILCFLLPMDSFAQLKNTDKFKKLIVGKWKEVEDNNCWSNIVEYKGNGLKIVTQQICIDGVLENFWFKVHWSISHDTIIEETIELGPGVAELSGVTLPHVEIDQIKLLDADRLEIIDNNHPNDPTNYKRLNCGIDIDAQC